MSDNLWEDRLDQPTLPELEEEDKLSVDTEGLLNLGYLSEELTLGGNDIALRTIYVGEELEIGLITKPYKDTSEEGRAYATALVAASIERINGKPLVQKLGPSDKDYLQRKFDYVRSNYFWPVISEIYEQGVIPLMRRQSQAINELRSKSQAIRPSSSPSSESQNEKDSSEGTLTSSKS